MVGAEGFIGSAVVVAALAAGAVVDAVCLAEPWRLAALDAPNLTTRRLPEDVWWSESGAEAAVASCDAAIVLAYRPPGGADPERHEREVNLAGAVRLATAAQSTDAAVVFASSAAVYGPLHAHAVTESERPAAATPYAQAKLEAEHELARLVPERRLGIARISTVYGPGENGPRAIPSFVRALAAGERPTVNGDGLDVHDYVHVADVAAALVNAAAAGARGEGAGVVNVASGRGRTTLEALEVVQDALRTALEPVHVPSPRPRARLVLDVARARGTLGLAPREDFGAAVAREADWLLRRLRGAPRPAQA